MTDAPEMCPTCGETDCREYICTEHANALIAAALEAAARVIEEGLDDVIAESGEKSTAAWEIRHEAKKIRALTPDDARAAYDQAIMDAEARGAEAKWQPIGTAPKEISDHVFVLDNEGNARMARWYDRSYIRDGQVRRFVSDFDFGDFSSNCYWPNDLFATHWMPLPAPPTPKQKDNEL